MPQHECEGQTTTSLESVFPFHLFLKADVSLAISTAARPSHAPERFSCLSSCCRSAGIAALSHGTFFLMWVLQIIQIVW